MLWVTYRQHRPELFVVLAAAVALAATIAIGAQVATSARLELGLDACPAVGSDLGCNAKLMEFSRRIGTFGTSMLLLYLFPAFVASFIGGSLFSRDFERGTHRLVWTQGITRTAWLVGKLTVVAGVAAAGAAIVAALAGRAVAFYGGLGSFRTATGPGPFSLFDFSAPAIVAYMVFGIAFGGLLSVAFRRSLPGMFLALVGFIGIRGLVEVGLRPKYLPPLSLGDGRSSDVPADAWDLGVKHVTATGDEVSSERMTMLLEQFYGEAARSYGFGSGRYLADNDVYIKHFYQPADRYWLFQSIESAIFLGLATMCVLLAVWMVRRRAV